MLYLAHHSTYLELCGLVYMKELYMRITYILPLHKRCVFALNLPSEHHIKIKPHPPDYMMKENKEEKNKRKKGGSNDSNPRRKKRPSNPVRVDISIATIF
jgi:hypothetical protein